MPKKQTKKEVTETAETATPKAQAAPPAPEKLIRIPLNCLIPTPNNPRHIDPKSDDIRELADSIKANGLLQPGVARPSYKVPGAYELLAGGRRYAAHKLLGAFDMLCIVRELDDKAALEVTVLENLQRTDLTPFEEARGVQSLLDTGHPIAEIAAELGKSPQWVARRARLIHLLPDMAAAMTDAGSTVGQMMMVAAMPAETQQAMLAEEHQFTWMLEPKNTGELEAHIESLQQFLAKAPFPLDYKYINVQAPRCAECQKRTGANPLLFDAEKAEKSDRCLDSACWAAKRKEHLDRALSSAKDTFGDTLVIVTTGYSNDREIDRLPRLGKEAWSGYAKAKKTTPGAVPAFITHGPGVGTVVWATKNERAVHSDPTPSKPAREVGTDGKPVPPKPHERQLALHQKRCAWMVEAFNESVVGNLGDLFGKCSHAKALNILLAFGSAFNTGGLYFGDSLAGAWENYEDNGAEHGPAADTLEAEYENHLAAVFHGRVRFQGLDQAERAFVEAARICRLLGYLLFKNHHEACMKALPVPKSWGAIPDPWADAPGDQVADPFDPKHEQPRTFKAGK